MSEYIEQAEKDLFHLYNRYQIVLDHGEGMRLFDTEGKSYLDFMSGIGVFALGYGDKKFNEAVHAQVDRLLHTSNYFYNEPAIEAARYIKAASRMDRVFFTNSGAEAVEGAIKAARKYGFLKDGRTDHEIIAMEHSFHGRTMGALSVTGKRAYRDPFEPMIGNIRFAEFNDIESVKKCINDKTVGILLETIQGEGGIYPADAAFLKELRRICDEKDILLILDEIQCGMGRTGEYYAWQGYDVKPDIMTTAKALGGGVPVGAFLVNEKVAANSLVAGDHGTTYGGNPLAGAAVCASFKRYEELDLLANVKKTGAFLYETLEGIKKENPHVKDHRGVGLMQGLEFDGPVADIIARALDKGLILINAGPNIIRFLPPLICGEAEISEMAGILGECM
ncbi:MAG: aspartate aminotransferase family protein [Lachnospiraceae bacterium]|nr:aspartate aminotransferase family protein [Lachnospiraceae bacterium]